MNFHQTTRQAVVLIAIALSQSGCGHPLDCAMGSTLWDDCSPGTKGYENRARLGENDAAQCSAMGYAPNSREDVLCRINLDNQRGQAQKAVIGSAIASGALFPKPAPVVPYQMPVNRPMNTTCNSFGGQLNCSTQ